jgi:galactose-1-phosphate uridylyltransferase
LGRRRERFLASIGRTYWLTAFAPLADREVVGIVSGRASLLDLDHEDLEALAEGISRALAYYRASDLDGFDLSLFSAPLDQTSSYRVNLSLAARTSLACPAEEASYFGPLQREAVVGMTPESLARELRSYFAPPSAL